MEKKEKAQSIWDTLDEDLTLTPRQAVDLAEELARMSNVDHSSLYIREHKSTQPVQSSEYNELKSEIKEIAKDIKKLQDATLLQGKEVLNIDEVCLLTGLKKDKIYRLTSKHQIPYYKSDDRKALRFKKSEIEAWLLAVRVKTDDELEADATLNRISKKNDKGGIKP
ncbi:MAG: helix-turn-helix domain-containing protein [Bacteroidales bacterium]|nr:helix-turn-helix domain-containing protein [Bacteroidales bacterium]